MKNSNIITYEKFLAWRSRDKVSGYVMYDKNVHGNGFKYKVGMICPSCGVELLSSKRFDIEVDNYFDDRWLCLKCGHIWEELWVRGYSSAREIISGESLRV